MSAEREGLREREARKLASELEAGARARTMLNAKRWDLMTRASKTILALLESQEEREPGRAEE